MQFILRHFPSTTRSGNIILQYREVDASINSFDMLMKKPTEQRPETRLKLVS
jgi:hypothetical protein